MSPNEAQERESDTRIVHVEKVEKAAETVKPSKLMIGDHVRVMKRKQVFSKGYEVRYSITVYTIVAIEGNYYVLNNDKRYREGDLQKIRPPKPRADPVVNEERKEEVIEPVEIRDVHREARKVHRVNSVLKGLGMERSNVRESARVRKPTAKMDDFIYGKYR